MGTGIQPSLGPMRHVSYPSGQGRRRLLVRRLRPDEPLRSSSSTAAIIRELPAPSGGAPFGASSHPRWPRAMRWHSRGCWQSVDRGTKRSKRTGRGLSIWPSRSKAWPICFTDPEGTAVEVFATAPFAMQQPFGRPIDLDQSDAEIVLATRRICKAPQRPLAIAQKVMPRAASALRKLGSGLGKGGRSQLPVPIGRTSRSTGTSTR